MEPDKFRKSRETINRLCENIDLLIDQRDLEESKACYQEASECLDTLSPQAEGEIQERSVKNLGVKIKLLSSRIKKLKPKKTASGQGKTVRIEWDEERIAGLSKKFLEKVMANIGNDPDAQVCFGTSGKGIRPNYQIISSDKKTVAYSGSSHKPNPDLISKGSGKLSPPFSGKVIEQSLS